MSNKAKTGELFGIGVGPGDPELITVKGLRLLKSADIVAFPCANANGGVARNIVKDYLSKDQEFLPLVYPVTASPLNGTETYEKLILDFYDKSAKDLSALLEQGKRIAIICVGDPFLYGSYMYWHTRLGEKFKTTVVPGISSTLASSVQMGVPLAKRDDVLTLLPGTLSKEALVNKLDGADCAVIIKLGRTFDKVIKAIEEAGLLGRAFYVERVTMEGQKIMPLEEAIEKGVDVPYFSLIVIPTNWQV